MCWRGNFNCTERYLLSLMFLIEPIWTRQPASQLAAQLGSFSSCGLHSCGTFDKDVRPSEPRQHSLYISSNLLVIGLDGSSCFWTRTVIPHERGERFNDQHHFVCPSACDSQRSLLIHPIIDSKTLIAVVAFNVVTFQHHLKKPNRTDRGSGWMRWEPKPRLCFPTGPLWSPPHSSYLSLPLLYPLCFPSQGLFHIELLEIPPRLLKGILHWHSAAISAGHAIWRRTTTTSFQSFGCLKND